MITKNPTNVQLPYGYRSSKGHNFVAGDFEYFTYEDQIFRAPLANPLSFMGIRQGARFECMASQLPLLRKMLGIQ